MTRLRVLTLVGLLALAALTYAAVIPNGTSMADEAGGKNILIKDDCDPTDPAWNNVGGCALAQGDVTLAEFAGQNDSPLADAVIGHQAWRNDPSVSRDQARRQRAGRQRGGPGAHVDRGGALRRRHCPESSPQRGTGSRGGVPRSQQHPPRREGARVRARSRHPPVPVLFPSVDARTDQSRAQPLSSSAKKRRVMTSRMKVIATLAAVAAVIGVAAGTATGSSSNSHANQLAGTWVVTIQRPPAPPITVYQAWNSDGTYLSYSGNGTLGDSPAGRSNEFGSWERVEGRLYASSGSWLRFNTQTGAHIGTTRIDRNNPSVRRRRVIRSGRPSTGSRSRRECHLDCSCADEWRAHANRTHRRRALRTCVRRLTERPRPTGGAFV